METHPRDVPISETFDLKDIADADKAIERIVNVGFAGQKKGFRVLMPKERRIAKRIGYRVTSGVSYGLRNKGHPRDVKFWTYHYDDDHYAIVLADRLLAESLGL